jgi:small GTP-binding protein
MLQKKICMLGAFATGKTSLVRQFVYSRFSDAYHSTVGVKIDRKTVDVEGKSVNLILWDLAGRDGVEEVPMSYLRGSSGLFFVADGTRRETLTDVLELRARAAAELGDLPSMLALNKKDLAEDWVLREADVEPLTAAGWRIFPTSAKTGEGVEAAFGWLAQKTVAR